jgi:signal transduction histidine kinase
MSDSDGAGIAYSCGAPPQLEHFNADAAMASWMHDLAPYGIFTTDDRLVVRSWNQWMVTHSGLAAEAVIGRRLTEVYPAVADRGLEEHFVRALRGEVSLLSAALHKYLLPLTSPVRESSNRHMLQTVRIAPLTSGDRVAGTLTLIEDVTQREHQAVILHRQQEHDRLLSEALGLLLRSENPFSIAAELFPRIAVPLKLDLYFNFLVAPSGDHLQLHSAGGITPEVRKAYATLPIGDTFCGQAAQRRLPVVESRVQYNESFTARGARRLGIRAYAAFPLLIADRVLGTLSFGSYERDEIAPDDIEFLGKIAQYVSIALDRAQREQALRAAQEKLRRHADDLESTVTERTARLHESIAQLESFSYTVAHDLRAPIRSLTGFTEVLIADYAATIPEEGRDLLERLRRASFRLDALTRDLLHFSRIARQDVDLEAVELTELVEDIVSVTPALQQGVLTVQSPLGEVLAQRTLLQQCLSNLFDNALKFARPGVAGAITVRTETRYEPAPSTISNAAKPFQSSTAAAATLSGGRRRIWVEDNGIGIPSSAHQKIFGIFERLPGPTQVEGTGIGLAIVARATEQMGGACGVESVPGEGSRFWLEFAVPPGAA